MHAIEYNYEPTSFTDTWTKNKDHEPNIILRNANDYVMPQSRNETFKKTTLYALLVRWALKAYLLESFDE
jgi:hypothetical protein